MKILLPTIILLGSPLIATANPFQQQGMEEPGYSQVTIIGGLKQTIFEEKEGGGGGGHPVSGSGSDVAPAPYVYGSNPNYLSEKEGGGGGGHPVSGSGSDIAPAPNQYGSNPSYLSEKEGGGGGGHPVSGSGSDISSDFLTIIHLSAPNYADVIAELEAGELQLSFGNSLVTFRKIEEQNGQIILESNHGDLVLITLVTDRSNETNGRLHIGIGSGLVTLSLQD